MSRRSEPVGQLHTTADVGRILGDVSDETVRRYIADGDLVAINIATKPGDVRWRVSDRAIAEFCAARTYQPRSRRRSVRQAS